MAQWMLVVFPLSVAYAVLGNVAVYWILRRRRIPMKFLWVGTPGYLYGLTIPGTALRRFALSTNIVFIVAILCTVVMAGGTR
jgi:hypothetical protein